MSVTELRPLITIAGRIRAAWHRLDASREEWIAASLEVIDALSEGRRQFTSDTKFGVWLVEEELDFIGHQDRAALLKMADHRAMTEAVLRETTSWSYRLIWKEVEARFTSAGKAAAEEEVAANVPEPTVSPDETPITTIAIVASEVMTELDVRHPFHGLVRGAEVAAIFRNANTRTAIGKILKHRKAGGELWELICESIDAGFLTPTAMTMRVPSLHFLFPQAPRGYARRVDLSRPKDRALVREKILPAALAHRDELLAAPARMEAIINAHWQAIADASRARREEIRRDAALQTMAANEEAVTVYGHPVWPPDGRGQRTYRQVSTAAWVFQDLLRALRHESSPASQAHTIRHTMRWLQRLPKDTRPTDLPEIVSLISQYASWLELDPEAETRWPITPKANEDLG